MSPAWRALLALAAAIAPAVPAAAAPSAGFRDVAATLGLDFFYFNGMSGELYNVEITGGGAALVDYDGDGDLDFYLVQGSMLGRDKTLADAILPPPPGAPGGDRLYRNDLALDAEGRPRLRLVDVTARAGIDAPGYGMGVAAGDIDGDGHVDLYVTNFGANQMLRNRGDGTFEDVTATSGTGERRWSVSAAFLDYDRDGDLDLYVGNYLRYDLAGKHECRSLSGAPDYCSPLTYPVEPDRLYRNQGDGRFVDVSTASGISEVYGAALGVVASDFDGDGWIDVYVANDGSENQLWMNRGDGTFVESAVLAGCAVNELGMPEGSMGVVAGDLDGDGFDDLFMTHIAAETNTLYLNDGSGMFHERTRASGLGPPSHPFTGFGAVLTDFDLDGKADLFVANGAVQRLEDQAARGEPYPLAQRDQLFHGLGGGRFVEAALGEAAALVEVGRGVSAGDLDRDGDEELVVVNSGGPVRLLESADAGGAAWLGARVLSGASAADAAGARVAVVADSGRAQWRRLGTDGSYASALPAEALFGLGGERAPVRLVVRRPGRAEVEWRGLPPNRRYLVY